MSIRKILLIIVVLAIVVFAVMVSRTYSAIRDTRAQIGTSLSTIASSYTSIVTDAVVPVRTAPDITRSQASAIGEMQTGVGALDTAMDSSVYTEQAARIHDLQISLLPFLATVQNSQSFAAQLSAAREETAETGQIRKTIDAYNLSAKQWNDLMQRRLARFVCGVLSVSTDSLPYLQVNMKDSEKSGITL